jgi:hypothetical protein
VTVTGAAVPYPQLHENVYSVCFPNPTAAELLGVVVVTEVVAAWLMTSHALTVLVVTVMEAALPSVSQFMPSKVVFAWTVQVP